MTKIKYKFDANTWITFILNKYQCIGRTVIIEGQELVAVITSDGKTGHIPFNEIDNPVKLNLIKSIPKQNQQKKSNYLTDEMLKTMCFCLGES